MADLDKNIVITPNNGSSSLQPNIIFTGKNNAPLTITITDSGNLTFSSVSGTVLTVAPSGSIFNISTASGTSLFTVTDTPEIITNAPITGAAGRTILANVSALCDGNRCVFDLKNDQTLLSSTYIVDSKDVQVQVNGQTLTPYVSQGVGPWIPAFDNQGTRSFRVRGNQLIIYNAPDVGSSVSVTVQKTSATAQTNRYPFSPTTIALGD